MLKFLHTYVEVKLMANQTFDRRSLSNSGSRKYFSATASRTHFMNVKARPQRGGIRL